MLVVKKDMFGCTQVMESGQNVRQIETLQLIETIRWTLCRHIQASIISTKLLDSQLEGLVEVIQVRDRQMHGRILCQVIAEQVEDI